jgi:hypothetical protein
MMTSRQFSTLHLINSSRMANQKTYEIIEAANILLSLSREQVANHLDRATHDTCRRSTRRKFTNPKYNDFEL